MEKYAWTPRKWKQSLNGQHLVTSENSVVSLNSTTSIIVLSKTSLKLLDHSMTSPRKMYYSSGNLSKETLLIFSKTSSRVN